MTTLTKTKSLDGLASTTPSLDNPWVLTTANIATGVTEIEEPIAGITRGHSAMREVALTEATYRSLGIPPTQKLLHKTDEHPDREYSHYAINPLQIEVAGTNFFRLLAPQYCSRAYLVVNQQDIADSCVIERIPEFKTIDQIHQHTDLALTKEDILQRGITDILVYNFLLQNNDCRSGNMGLTADGQFATIDFDQALWSYPTCALFNNPNEARPSFNIEKFPLTLRDLQEFPLIQDTNPTHWPTRDIKDYNEARAQDKRDQAFANLLKSLKDDPDFIKQKYFCYFKFCILFQCKTLIEKELAKSMSPASEPFKIIVESLHNRAVQLQYLLLADEKFEPYLQKIQPWFETIEAETLIKHPRIQHELLDSYGNFYNARAIKVTEKTPAPLVRRASAAAKKIEKSPERQYSLDRTSVKSEHEREKLIILATTIQQLLEKNKKRIHKIKSKGSLNDLKTLEFCCNMMDACNNFKTSDVIALVAQQPKPKLGFFSWFSHGGRFRISVDQLMKTEHYRAVSKQPLKAR